MKVSDFPRSIHREIKNPLSELSEKKNNFIILSPKPFRLSRDALQ